MMKSEIEYFGKIKILFGYIVQIIVSFIISISLGFGVFLTLNYKDYYLSIFLLLLLIGNLYHTFWIWKFRLFILSPTIIMDRRGIVIKRKKKHIINWDEIQKVIIIGKISFVGLLYNIERNAIIFELKERKEFIIVDKGVYHANINKLLSVIEKYCSTKIKYKNIDKLKRYKSWINSQ